MPQSVLVARHEATSPLQRVFLGWERAALASAADLLADHYTRGNELRMQEVTVVLPGARAGRRLKEMLAEEAEQRGVRLVPPQVTTISALPELLYTPDRPVAGQALSRQIWARALRQLPPEQLQTLFSVVPEASDLRGWFRLARTVEDLHLEVGGAGLRFTDVITCCGDGLLFADTDRWMVMAEAQAAYETELARLGYTDRGLARIHALETGALSLGREVWLVGVVEMPGVLRRMLEALPAADGLVHVLVHAPADLADGFDSAGCLRPEFWNARPVPLRDDQFEVRGRPAEQAAEVVRSLASLGGAYAAEQIAIAAPNEELVPYVEQHLGAAGVPVHTAGGMPIEQSPVARLLAACADYLDGSRFEACAALVRHPDLGRWLRRSASSAAEAKTLAEQDRWIEVLDAYFTECLPARLNGFRANGQTRGADTVEALCKALDDDRLLGRFRGRRRFAAWMPEVIELVVEVYGGADLDRADASDRRLLDACQHLRAAAADLVGLPDEVDEPCAAATAIRRLLDEVEGVTLAPDPDRAAVELLGWLELRLDDAPVAVVTGFNEPFLPESVNAHPFLPNALRERLGLVCNKRRYARDAYELTSLLHTREQVRVIAGRWSATGDPLRPSRLLFAVEGRAVAERVRRFYAEENLAPASASVSALSAESPGGFQLPPEPVLSAPEPLLRLPVTSFRHLLADPYGFALEKILRLTPLDDRARELDGLRFGSLAHDVLEHFAHSDDVHSADEKRICAQLDRLLDEAAHARFGTHALPAVRIQIEQLRLRLHGFARWHASWVADGWRVVGVECQTPEEGVPFAVDGEVMHLTGRIDRIDYHPEQGIWAVFDYKTGDRGLGPEDTHRTGKKDARQWTDLQLPLYRHLLPHVRDAEGQLPCPDGVTGDLWLGYIALPHDLERAGASFAEWTSQELEEADECAREVVRLVRENAFAFDPERARVYRDTPLAGVLGIGYLESAAGAEEESQA